MKYIAGTLKGSITLLKNVEIEIDDAKMEARLQETINGLNRGCDDKDWPGSWHKPQDEVWIDLEWFADCADVYDELEDRAMQIVDEWEQMPDCIDVFDCDIDKVKEDYSENNAWLNACRAWLTARGWFQHPNDDLVWCHKK